MITPSFALDFTAGSLDPRITFTRSGATATRINASGYIETVAADTPRFDYNPVTLVCRGLLIEETRTNSMLQSEALNTTWVATAASVSADDTLSPSNTLTADKIVEDTTTNVHRIVQTIAHTSGTTYTISLYAKSDGSNRQLCIFMPAAVYGTGSNSVFNLATGAITSDEAGTATITNASNGWYRCTVTRTATVTASGGYQLRIANVAAPDALTYLGNGTSGFFAWGAQVEVGAFATSYIPTVASTVTRNPDIATITGTNFSDWWQASKGGVLVRTRPGTVSGVRPWVQFDDGTANEIIALRVTTTNPELYIVDGGIPQAQIDAGTIAANTDYSLTGWWATNDCKARLNNGAVVTDTTATIPTVTQARLGSDGTNYLNGHLASISYYDSFFGRRIYTRRKNKAIFNLM